MSLYKLVVRDKNGKVIQIHESYYCNAMLDIVVNAADEGYSVTVTQLN